ncbi:MAG: lycopene cyclase domain-containing protein, partial [Bacteroidales bacterium]|nr:lycopene cyclase domain-containing protein [Bacteroidales bacterium]
MSFYLIVLLACISVPFAFSFEKNLRLYKRWKYVFSGIFITMLIFISWDVLFTHLGIWEFNPRYNSGVYIFGLPLEEHLFFIAIPYACLFSYYAIQFHFPWYKVNDTGTKIISAIIVIASLILAFTNTNHVYTLVVFLVIAAYT